MLSFGRGLLNGGQLGAIAGEFAIGFRHTTMDLHTPWATAVEVYLHRRIIGKVAHPQFGDRRMTGQADDTGDATDARAFDLRCEVVHCLAFVLLKRPALNGVLEYDQGFFIRPKLCFLPSDILDSEIEIGVRAWARGAVQVESLHGLSYEVGAGRVLVEQHSLEACVGPDVFSSKESSDIEQGRSSRVRAEDDASGSSRGPAHASSQSHGCGGLRDGGSGFGGSRRMSIRAIKRSVEVFVRISLLHRLIPLLKAYAMDHGARNCVGRPVVLTWWFLGRSTLAGRRPFGCTAGDTFL